MSDPTPTLYEWAGGTEAFHRLTSLFYERVRDDPVLAPVFAGMDPAHPAHVADWLIDGRPSVDLSLFAPGRFAAGAHPPARGRRRQELRASRHRAQQRLNLGAQRGVLGAGLIQVRGALRGRQLRRGAGDLPYSRPIQHGGQPVISRRSQARA